MTSLAKSLAAVLLAGTAIAAPATANTILFSTGTLPNGTPLRPGQPPAGTITVRGGVTQVENGDGEVFSFVGDATFDASVPDVSITDGRVTVSGGRDGAAAFSVGGNIATSVNGQNATASFTVDAGAIAAGRVLGGTVTVTAGGVTRSFDLGQAFAAAIGAAARPVSSAGVAPISAPPAPQSGADLGLTGIDTNQNPRFATLPGGSEAALLSTIIARQNAATAFDFRQVSDAYLNANLASVIYGERLGSLSALIAAARALALINGVQGGSTRAADLAYLDALLALFRADGFATGAPATTTSSITQYNQIVAAGLPTDLATVTRIVSTWVGGLQTATSGTSGGYSTAQLETLARYLRNNGVPASAAAADRTRIDALFAFLDVGGAFGKTPGVVLPNAGSTLTAGVRSSLTSGDYVGSQARFEVGADVPTMYAPAVAVAFDATGAPTQMPTGFVKGNLVGVEGASGADWIIGRYAATTRGTDGTHFALAKPYTLTLPTSGTARYALTHATTPQYIDGRVVTASTTEMTLAFAFGPAIKYGLEGSISATDLGGVRTFRFATDGGLAAPSVNARTGGGMIAIGDAIVVTANSDTCGTGSAGCLFRPSLVLGGTTGGIVAGTYLISQVGSFPILGGAVILQGTLPVAVVTPPVVTPPVVTPPTTGNGIVFGATTRTAYASRGFLTSSAGAGLASVSNIAFDASGRPTSLGTFGAPGTATLAQLLSGPGWVIGRWAGGTFNVGTQTTTFAANGGGQFGMTTPLTALPASGSALYTVSAFTDLSNGQTYNNTLTNTALTMNLGVAFGSSVRFGFDGRIGVTFNGAASSVSFSSPGGSVAPSLTGSATSPGPSAQLSLSGTADATASSGNLCAPISACRIDAYFAGGGGADVTQFVAAYGLVSTTGSFNPMNGAAVLTRVSSTPDTPTTPTTGITPVTSYTFGSYDGSITSNQSSNTAGRLTSVLIDGTRVVGTGERGSEFVYRATLSDSQSGTGWVIGRWSNGTVQNTAFTRTIPAGQAEHYAFTTVRPTSIPTTGLATFGLAQFTTPSLASGAAVTNAQMYGGVAIQFATTPLFGISGALTLSAGGTPYRYDFASSGGLTAPSIVTNRPNGLLALDGGVAVTSNDPSCGTSCRFFTGFVLGGTTANVVAGGWLIGLQSGTNVVAGSAVYLQGSPVTTAPTGTVSGTGTSVVIASNTQASQTASFTTDANGLASYTVGTGTAVTTANRGTTTDRGFTRVGDIIGWTRWAGGTVQQTVGGATGSTTYAENNGELVVWGTRATNIPTSGNATYDLLGASAVTLTTDATPGTVDSATLNVAFGSAPKVGIDIGLRVGGNDYLVSSTGGAANPLMTLDTATMGFGGDLAVSTGNGCTASTCSGGVQGFLAGVGASHAGARFTFQTAPGRGQPTAAGVVTFTRRP